VLGICSDHLSVVSTHVRFTQAGEAGEKEEHSTDCG
jgi:hypothetical protein